MGEDVTWSVGVGIEASSMFGSLTPSYRSRSSSSPWITTRAGPGDVPADPRPAGTSDLRGAATCQLQSFRVLARPWRMKRNCGWLLLLVTLAVPS